MRSRWIERWRELRGITFFTHQITDLLPHTLTHLHLGKKFFQPLDRLPPFLEELHVAHNFIYPLDLVPKFATLYLYLVCSFFLYFLYSIYLLP